jgi:hypothetical protein
LERAKEAVDLDLADHESWSCFVRAYLVTLRCEPAPHNSFE